jgi:glycosyltransferase involved in cell wall biosynthesis
MRTNRNVTMVIPSAGDWTGIQHRPHHFAKRAAKSGRRVLYINPPVSMIAPLKNKKLINNWKKWMKGVDQVEKNLYVYSPPPFIPFGNKYRWVNKVNQVILARSLKKVLHDFLGTKELYTYLPNSIDLLPNMSFESIYYDCVDDHASFSGLIDPTVVHQMEKDLMSRADVCFATAHQLLEDRIDWNSNYHLVQNGAEYEHFSRVQEQSLTVPDDIKKIKHPIVGFIGGISDWINLDLIASTAKQLPEVSFVLIGPIDTGINQFKGLKNCYFFGPKPYDQLPNYIQSFDLCLIPFKINKLTKSVNPIKMYEYLSAGKPIVSTALPEVVRFKEIISIVNSSEEMVNEIRAIINNPSKYNSAENIASRQKVGRENSWDARWEKVENLIDKSN